MGRPRLAPPAIGSTYGKWTVLDLPVSDLKAKCTRVRCQCACGAVFLVSCRNLVRGETFGCRACWGKRACSWNDRDDDLICRLASEHAGAEKIAKLLERSIHAVRHRAQTLGVRIRRPRDPYKAYVPIEKVLSDFDAGASVAGVARRYDVDWHVIARVLRESGRETRPLQKHVTLTPKAIEIIAGCLLGDGCIAQSRRKGRSPRFALSQCERRKSWPAAIAQALLQEGVQGRLYRYSRGRAKIGDRWLPATAGLTYETLHYVQLKSERSRWYSSAGKKFVPRDLVLTPIVAANWFAGDGTTRKTGDITLCTDGFSRVDVEFLVELLRRDLTVSAYVAKVSGADQWHVHIGKLEDAWRFFETVRPHLHPAFAYKLRYARKYEGRWPER